MFFNFPTFKFLFQPTVSSNAILFVVSSLTKMKLFECETQLLKNIQIYFLKMLSHKHFFENFFLKTLSLSSIIAKLKG